MTHHYSNIREQGSTPSPPLDQRVFCCDKIEEATDDQLQHASEFPNFFSHKELIHNFAKLLSKNQEGHLNPPSASRLVSLNTADFVYEVEQRSDSVSTFRYFVPAAGLKDSFVEVHVLDVFTGPRVNCFQVPQEPAMLAYGCCPEIEGGHGYMWNTKRVSLLPNPVKGLAGGMALLPVRGNWLIEIPYLSGV
jgi:hypothetical protein